MSDVTPGTIPDGWYVLWCPACFTSLAFTEDVIATRDMGEWHSELNWAVAEVDHDITNPAHRHDRETTAEEADR